ncbi:HAMP domain-containing sensor histidine kinase [Larkinella arboricola]|uniref:histidine kinase n=1 Tax=Larkinella arboricola TaxID=643671 RepID=A0A327XEP4_LARAB|nr:sensor histidine kinase [Larkinella arboricola]RAK02706.1 signal transduction histidine kinase [Larkinella arboricola]
MSLQNRLTLLSTAIVSVLLAVFCLFMYLMAEQYRNHAFLTRLRAEALTAGHLLVGRERLGPALYKLIDKNQLTVLPDEEIIIYNVKNELIYESGTDYISVTPATLQRVRELKTTRWREGNREIVGMLFTEEAEPFVILASAVDIYGVRTVQDFARLLAGGWFLMTGIVLVAGRFFMGRIVQPISRINQRIDEITASNMSLRLPEGKSGDELTQLAQRFNRMLNRLEEAFRLQRSFVSHASHELRTPLTAITGQLEVSLLADDEPDELRATLRSVLDDVRGLNRMANGLLALASASMDSSAVPMGPVQLDHLLEQVCREIQRLQPNYTVHLQIDPVKKPYADWQLTGSEPLLRTAFFNLLDNGGKFSPDHTVTMQLSAPAKSMQLRVHNAGSVIPVDQLAEIFVPFQRGRNASGLPGYGIGLPLTERIVQLHRGQIRVESSAEAGTTFVVTFPR